MAALQAEHFLAEQDALPDNRVPQRAIAEDHDATAKARFCLLAMAVDGLEFDVHILPTSSDHIKLVQINDLWH